MRTCRYVAVVILLAGIAAGCGRKKTDDASETPRMVDALPPDPGKLETPVPDKFRVKFETSKGDFVLEVTKDWAPLGAAQFYRAVKAGFYDGCRFYRVMPDFVVQWGINGDPAIQKKWRGKSILDDPVRQSNKKGTITFANSGENTRSTDVFINLNDNPGLDGRGFSPFGKVISGMDAVEKINSEYGERPDQSVIQRDGNEYLNAVYPRLDYIKKAAILKDGDSAKTGPSKPAKSAKAESKPEKKSVKTKKAKTPD